MGNICPMPNSLSQRGWFFARFCFFVGFFGGGGGGIILRCANENCFNISIDIQKDYSTIKLQ